MIVGGGSSAFAAAIKANDQAIKMLIVNGGLPLGGTCVNVGCVPSKFLIRAGESVHKASYSSFKGIEPNKPKINFREIIEQKRELVADMQQRKYADLLAGLPYVKVIEGMTKFVGDRTVEVEAEQYEGLKVILATGASTYIPNIDGVNTVPYLTNITLFELDDQPASLTVLGGGYIALEIAQAYNRLGTKVTLLQRSSNVLSKQAKDITDEITKHLLDEGINILTDTTINKVWEDGEEIKANITQNGNDDTITSSHLLVAAGIKPNTEKLGLEKIKVNVDRQGNVVVDEFLQTSNPDVFAVGDVTNLPAYVYTAAYEGNVAVQNAFSNPKQKVDFTALP